jgi:hypothetical protein
MEEVFGLIVQLVIEVLIQSVLYLPFDFSFYGNAHDRGGWGWMVAYLILGGLIGALSLVIAPNLLLPSTALRLANLFLAPIVAGGMSWTVAKWRDRDGVAPRRHFWFGFCFALAFAGVRLAYAAR